MTSSGASRLRIKPPDWLMAAGGIAMFLLGIGLPWSTYGARSGDTALHYPLTGALAWVLVSAVGVIAVLRASGRLRPGVGVGIQWTRLSVMAAGLATLLMIVQVILGGRSIEGVTVDRGIGMIVGLVCCVVALAGAVQAFQADSTGLVDFSDMERLRADDVPRQ